MAEIFLGLSGKGAQAFVAFYLEHQLVFNTIIALYGIILVVAHQNLRRIESLLQERYGLKADRGEAWGDLLQSFATDPDAQLIEDIRRRAFVPFVSSPYYFSLYRIDRPHLVTVIGKKHTVDRKRLESIERIADASDNKETVGKTSGPKDD